jgi:hypothetical protein
MKIKTLKITSFKNKFKIIRSPKLLFKILEANNCIAGSCLKYIVSVHYDLCIQVGCIYVFRHLFLWCADKRNLTELPAMQVIFEQNFSFFLFTPADGCSHIHMLHSTLAKFRANICSSDNRYIGEAA